MFFPRKMLICLYTGLVAQHGMLTCKISFFALHLNCIVMTIFILTFTFSHNFRTPMIAAMHEDESPDLREVERILREVLEVTCFPLLS